MDPGKAEVHTIVEACRAAVALLVAPLEYKVEAQDDSGVFAEPQLQAASLGRLREGEAVFGYPALGWLRVAWNPGVHGWVPLGRHLVSQCLQMKLRGVFLHALELEWLGLDAGDVRDAKIMYLVEWQVHGAAAAAVEAGGLRTHGYAATHSPEALLTGLPAGTPLRLRAAARVLSKEGAGEVRWVGPWLDATTAPALAEEVDTNIAYMLDPFGQERGGCVASGCYGYLWGPALVEEEEQGAFGLNSNPESIRCLRCGHAFTAHLRAGVEDSPALEKFQLESYTVVQPFVNVRSSRSTQGGHLGLLKQGKAVRGRREGAWLRLDRGSAAAVGGSAVGGAAAWVLVDGRGAGLGQLLLPTEKVPPELRERWRNEEEERRRAKGEAVTSARAPWSAGTRGRAVKEVGRWAYGPRALEYEVGQDFSRSTNGGAAPLRFTGPHSRAGTVSGILVATGNWLQADLTDPGGELVGTIRLSYTEEDDTILSNYRTVGQATWGKDTVAKRVHNGDDHSAGEQLGERAANRWRSDRESKAQDALLDPHPELLTKLYAAPLMFLVVGAQVFAHERPSTAAPRTCKLHGGEEVEGWQQGRWVKLREGTRADDIHGWVLLSSESSVYLRGLLPHLRISRRTFSEAAILEWDRVPAKTVEYRVDWSVRDEPGDVRTAVDRESMAMARVHGLPHDSILLFRVTARVLTDAPEQGGEVFAELESQWEEAETGPEIDEISESNLCLDPLANFRGRCMDCPCRGFVLSEYGDGVANFRDVLEDLLCRRCSCSCTRHYIVGEYTYHRPAKVKARALPLQAPPSAPDALQQPSAPAPPLLGGPRAEPAAAPAQQRPEQQHSPQEGPRRQGPPPAAEPQGPGQQVGPRPEKHNQETPKGVWRAEDAAEGDRVKFVLERIAEAQTLYEVLGVVPDTPEENVRRAFRQVSLNIHPDKVQHRADPELEAQAEAAFKIISAAYEVLGDPSRRAAYDRTVLFRAASWARAGGATLAKRGGIVTGGLTGLSFLKKFLGRGSFGWDLSGKPMGDHWEERGQGLYGRSDKAIVHITHAITGEELKFQLERGTTIGQLKKLISKQVRRGPESRIELALRDGTELSDNYRLSSASTEALVLVGIALGPPKEVEVCLCHADTGARVRVAVLDTSTVGEVREAALKKFDKWDPRTVRLGVRCNVGRDRFRPLEDSEPLAGREQMLVLGAEIVVKLSKEEATELQMELIEAYGKAWFQEELDSILKDHPVPEGLADAEFKERFSALLRRAQEATLVKHGFDGPHGAYHMMSAFSEVGSDPDVVRLAGQIDEKLRVTAGCVLPALVEVLLEGKGESSPVKIKVLERSTVGDLRAVVARRFGVEASSLRLLVPDVPQPARRSDPAPRPPGSELEDGDPLGSTRHVVVLGVDLTAQAPRCGPRPAAQPAPAHSRSLSGAEAEKRIAGDGKAYTYQEFLAYFGKEGERNWNWATPTAAHAAMQVPRPLATVREAAGKAGAVGAAAAAPAAAPEVPEAPEKAQEEGAPTAKGHSAVQAQEAAEALAKVKAEGEREVEVEVHHVANRSHPVKVQAMGCWTALAVYRELAKAVRRPEVLLHGRLAVRRAGGGYEAIPDAARVSSLALSPGDQVVLLNVRLDPDPQEVLEKVFTEAERRRATHGPGGGPPAAAPSASATSGPTTAAQAGKAKRPEIVEVTIRSIHTGRSQGIEVPASATAAEVKAVLATLLGRPEVRGTKLLRRNNDNGGYSSIPDDEVCGARRQLYVMSVDLEPLPGAPGADSRQAPALRGPPRSSSEAPNLDSAFPLGGAIRTLRATVLREGEDLKSGRVADLEAGQLAVVTGHGAGRRLQVELLPQPGEVGWVTTATKAGETIIALVCEDAASLPMEPSEPELVVVVVTHATSSSGGSVDLFVLSSATLSDAKEALAAKLQKPEVLQRGRFVQKKGATSYAGLRDEALLAGRRALLYLGTELR